MCVKEDGIYSETVAAQTARKPPTQPCIIYLLSYNRKMLVRHPREPRVSLNKTYLRISVRGSRSDRRERECKEAKDRRKHRMSACTPVLGPREVTAEFVGAKPD